MAKIGVCVNRVQTALARSVSEFQAAGFDACGVSFLDVLPLDVSLRPEITELDRYAHIIVTSPEAANQLTNAVLARWPQWPLGLTIWCVGEATAAHIPEDAGAIQVAPSPGSSALMELMRCHLDQNARCLVATAEGSGQQFAVLQSLFRVRVDWLELYQLVPTNPINLSNCFKHAIWVHGSAHLLRACIHHAQATHVSLADVTHCVTSDSAQAYLPLGWRYYRVDAPTPQCVRLALEGEPCVKA
jgi:uroporphyrinogen-III synthase